MATDREQDGRYTAVLWAMGAAWGITLGALIMVLWRERRASSPSPVTINFGEYPRLGLGEPARMAPLPVVQAATLQTAALTRPTKLDTYTLSSDPTSPSRVATAASERHWRVRLHNVGPPGSFAVIGTSFTGLSFPASQGITLPAGGDHEVRLRPREALFAMGSVPGVVLSVSSAEEIA